MLEAINLSSINSFRTLRIILVLPCVNTACDYYETQKNVPKTVKKTIKIVFNPK